MVTSLLAWAAGLPLSEIFMRLATAFGLGSVLALTYRRTHTTLDYSINFVNALLILPAAAAVLVLVTTVPLMRAVGLVGVLSVLRLRTLQRGVRNLVFCLLALVVGITAGLGQYAIAFAAAVIFLIGIFIVYRRSREFSPREDALLRFSVTPDERGALFHEEALRHHVRRSQLLEIKSRDMGDVLELSYLVRLKNPERPYEFLRSVRAIGGIEDVSLTSPRTFVEAERERELEAANPPSGRAT